VIIDTDIAVEADEFSKYKAEIVSIGDRAMEFVFEGYKTYTDEKVTVFENQETMNDIEMEAEEAVPAP
jgi:hypothetical protein